MTGRGRKGEGQFRPYVRAGEGGDKRQEEEGAFLLIHNPGEREWGEKKKSGGAKKNVTARPNTVAIFWEL